MNWAQVIFVIVGALVGGTLSLISLRGVKSAAWITRLGGKHGRPRLSQHEKKRGGFFRNRYGVEHALETTYLYPIWRKGVILISRQEFDEAFQPATWRSNQPLQIVLIVLVVAAVFMLLASGAIGQILLFGASIFGIVSFGEVGKNRLAEEHVKGAQYAVEKNN